ncbi:MAG: Zn-ribbon domain-containing OB-fold protein [Candidatus Thermoplasmatota archaeon]
MEEYPGISLTKEEIKNIITVYYKPNAKYRWATGIAIGRYLSELKNCKIIGRKCRKCNRILVPPRIFCELCYRNTDEWVYVKDTGKVNTFAICYIDTDASRMKEPKIPAVIELDGASEGIGILHLLGEVKKEDIKIGMKVKAVWNEFREGKITDIKYFKPMEE